MYCRRAPLPRIVGSLLAAVHVGCAGFRGSDALPSVDPTTLQSSPATPARVYTRWTFAPGGLGFDPERVLALGVESKERFDRALLATGCCTIVDTTEQADLVVEGTYHGQDLDLAELGSVLSSATLTVLPAWANLRYRLSARALAASRRHDYDVRDSLLAIKWLPLIVATPVAHPVDLAQEVQTNVLLTLIQRMKSDGLLQPPPVSPAAARAG